MTWVYLPTISYNTTRVYVPIIYLSRGLLSIPVSASRIFATAPPLTPRLVRFTSARRGKVINQRDHRLGGVLWGADVHQSSEIKTKKPSIGALFCCYRHVFFPRSTAQTTPEVSTRYMRRDWNSRSRRLRRRVQRRLIFF